PLRAAQLADGPEPTLAGHRAPRAPRCPCWRAEDRARGGARRAHAARARVPEATAAQGGLRRASQGDRPAARRPAALRLPAPLSAGDYAAHARGHALVAGEQPWRAERR